MQFTAVKPDDILVLNQVESPNYGRYKVTTVNDLGDYVNVIIEFQVGEGTILEGDTIALQAFPASEGGDDIWEVTGGGNAKHDGAVISTSYFKSADAGLQLRDDAVSVNRVNDDLVLSTASTGRMTIGTDGTVSTAKDGKSLTIDANVGELGVKSRITTDTGALELKAGSGGLPDVTITDAGLTTEADMQSMVW